MPTPVKRGRKQKHYVTSDGETILGLSRLTDGRWRVIGTHVRFTEPDERKAVERFRRMDGSVVEGVIGGTKVRARRGELLDLHDQITAILEDRVLWEKVACEIRNRPQWVADMTGIEQIAYLRDLKPPEKLPTPNELEQVWKDHFNKSAEQKRKVLHAWRDFVSTTKIACVEDITSHVAVAYRDAVYARGWTGKTQQNLFTRVRRLISFAKSRAVAVEALSRTLDYLTLLTPCESTVNLDPKPVDPADFRALLNKASGDDRAMLLLCLNAALYLKEAVELKWSDVKDGCLVAHRRKTGKVLRVAPLWPITLDALAKVKRRGEFVFYAYDGSPLGVKGAEARFRKLRDDARVAVTASMLRDGAFTAAVRANVPEGLVKLLVGHRGSGMSDHYVARCPEMVKPASDAVYHAYFGHETAAVGAKAAG